MFSRARTQSALTGQHPLSRLFREVSGGLQSTPRRIPEKLLYDQRGAELFEEITRLDAYYPTRLEIEILEACLAEVRELVGPDATVVEFGSGSGRKTSVLLDSLDRPARCIPVDISETQLLGFADRLQAEYPGVDVLPVVADYTQPFSLPKTGVGKEGEVGRILFFFPGSSIGNFKPTEAERFLHRVGRIGGPGSSLLIGVDCVKEREPLLQAYDDPEGVTSEFNRNALRHLNELFDGDFAVSSFVHRAVWNAARSRIEMRLVCTVQQDVSLGPAFPDGEPLRIRLEEGEEIVTEHSYKYGPGQFEALCRSAGWETIRRWTDPRGWFAVHFLEWEANGDGTFE